MQRAATIATITGLSAALILGIAGPAVADSTVVVRGTAFPEGRAAQLSFVGCEDLYQRTDELLQPYVSRGPDQVPTGRRSLRYDLEGGNAVGSLHYVDSMADTTVAALSVHTAEPATGVAYAGYQDPADAGTALVWFGRADLVAEPGAWHTIEATALAYDWTKFDMAAQTPVDELPSGTASVADFAAAHGGDGAGFYTVGFGCDGTAFNMDAWRIGTAADVTTYDLEGLRTVTTIKGSEAVVGAGDEVVLSGSLRDGTGAPLSRASLVLEAKARDSAGFETVQVVAAGLVDGGLAEPAVVVTPEIRTVYRWRFADRPLAEGSVSEPFTVDVAP